MSFVKTKRQVRRATRYRRASDVLEDLWGHVQHFVFAKAVKAEHFEDEDLEEADEAADVKISEIISSHVALQCSPLPGLPSQRDM